LVGSDAPPIRAAEVVGAISLATDLGTGQPLEHTLRTAILSVRLGELAGASAEELFDAYYVALLHSFGCTSDGPEATELYGDDIEPRAAFALVDAGSLEEVGAFLTAMVGGGRPPDVRAAMVADALANALPLAQATFALHCEVAQRLAGWLGFGSGTLDALAFVFERWDGHGLPAGAAAQDIALPARLLHVARDISVFLSAAGADEARAVIERRAGAAYDPRLAALATEHFDELLSGLDEARIWEQAIDSEPPPQRWMAGEEIDAAFGVVATFTDLKSRWLRGHAEGVAELAEAAAWRLELAADEVTRVRRAAPRSPSTWAASACPTRSGRSRARSVWGTGSGCAYIRTSPSARSPTRGHWHRSARWPALTTSASMAPATTARCSHRASSARLASSPPPTPTRRCASSGPTGLRSTRPAPKRSCWARRARGGSAPRPSMRCSRLPGTACAAARTACPED
jgi:hypothetical protein